MADDGSRFHFALSLHVADDYKRNQIVPLNKKYPLKELTDSLKYYHAKPKRGSPLSTSSLADLMMPLQMPGTWPSSAKLPGKDQPDWI